MKIPFSLEQRSVILLSLVLVAGCGGSDDESGVDAGQDTGAAQDGGSEDAGGDAAHDAGSDAGHAMAIQPGVGIGDVRMGMTYAEVKEIIGTHTAKLMYNRIIFLEYRDLKMDVVVTSTEDFDVNDASIVIALGAAQGGDFSGAVLPGASRADVEAAFGAPSEDTGDFAFYKDGVSFQYDGDTVVKIGVFETYALNPDPPEMTPASK